MGMNLGMIDSAAVDLATLDRCADATVGAVRALGDGPTTLLARSPAHNATQRRLPPGGVFFGIAGGREPKLARRSALVDRLRGDQTIRLRVSDEDQHAVRVLRVSRSLESSDGARERRRHGIVGRACPQSATLEHDRGAFDDRRLVRQVGGLSSADYHREEFLRMGRGREPKLARRSTLVDRLRTARTEKEERAANFRCRAADRRTRPGIAGLAVELARTTRR